MKRRPPSFLVLTGLLVLGSCVRSDSPTQVNGPVSVPLAIQPAIVPSPANADALPINRIRARVTRVEDGAVLGETEVDVSPSAAEWALELAARMQGESAEVRVIVALLHVADGGESVEFSGMAGPFTIRPGELTEATEVDLVRGPLANFYVTGVTVTGAPETLYEGRSAAVEAAVTTSLEVEPQVFLTVLEPSILSAADSTVTGLLPGTARVVASAGAFADTVSVVVQAAPADVLVSPESIVVPAAGDTAVFSAAVVDARGDTLPEESVVWSSGSPAVATSLGGGSFEAVSQGSATVQAASTFDESIVGTATVVVEASAPGLALTAAADDPSPADGDTVQVTVAIVNGAGSSDASGVAVTHRPDAQLSVVAATPDQGSYDVETGIWSVGALPAGSTAGLILDLAVGVGTGGSTAVDSLWISTADPVDPDVSNDTAAVSLSIAPRNVDVAVTKAVDNAQPLAGTPVTFTVSVTNNGPGPVTDVAVHDSLDVIFESPVHELSTGSVVGDTLWTIPSLAEGETATWWTSATVSTNATGASATNTALLRSLAQNDTLAPNDAASVEITVPLSEPPTVSIILPPDSSVFEPGELATFEATATDPEDGDVGASIQWTSSLDGPLATGPSFETDQLSTGVHTITATATDSDGGTGSASITVTVALYTIPATLNVPFGGTASMPISLTEPAPANGVTLSVTSADPTVTAPLSSTVVIPGGAQSANATLEGLSPGTTEVSVSSAQYGVVTSTVSVTAQLNILSSTARFPSTFTDDIEIQLESGGAPLAAPTGGLTVTFVSSDATCASPPADLVIPEGLIGGTATIAYGGSATLPCTTFLSATAQDVEPDSVEVTVDPEPQINLFNTLVGSGLQQSTSVSLGATLPDGETLTVTSPDPNVLLAPDGSTVGTRTLDLVGPFTSRSFVVQALEGFTGQVTLTASAPAFSDGSATVTVVEPGVRVVALATSTTTLSSNDAFYAQIGRTNGSGGFAAGQALRAGAEPLTLNFTSSAPSVATLFTEANGAGSPQTLQIQPGSSNTPTSVAAGGIAVDPLTAGSTVIQAEASNAGYVTTNTVTVDVSAPGITLFGTTVGSGLQQSTSVSLGATLPDGQTLTVTSSSPFVVLAPDGNTAGSQSLDLVGPFTSRSFVVQALEGFIGEVTLTASAPGFTDGGAVVTVVQPGIRLVSVSSSNTVGGSDDPIYAQVGRTNDSGGFAAGQQLRAGALPLAVTFTSSAPSVATLFTEVNGAGSPQTLEIQPGSANTATSVSAGGIAVSPVANGTTQISAAADAFISTSQAFVDVTINP